VKEICDAFAGGPPISINGEEAAIPDRLIHIELWKMLKNKTVC